jgi:hypothetical protein
LPSYLIGYDLVGKPIEEYEDLFDAIKALGKTWHCLDSTWIVKHAGPAKAIRDALTPHIHANDRLLVVKLTGEGAWRGFNKACSEWLLKYL